MRFFVAILFLAVFTGRLQAQLCQGSLGDPVVKITFGAGPNPGPQLYNTSYQYLAADCPNDGFYTVRNSTSSCFGFTWHSLGSDHTGDPNGYFMLVNASYQPGQFYQETVNGLCPGTTFEFAAWILNILRPTACGGNGIKPNITFTIETLDGQRLKTFSTGDIPSISFPVWKQYGAFFQTPDSVSSVLIRMTNNAPGGCGNDIALDDITFRPCGPEIGVSISGVSGDTVNVCEGQKNVFTITSQLSAGYNNPAFQWQQSIDSGQTWVDITSATGNTYLRPQSTTPGEYQYRVQTAEKTNINNPICRINSTVVDIAVNPLPKVFLPSNYSLCTNDTFVLRATGAVTYNWTGPNNFSSSDSTITVVRPATSYTGKYYLTATSDKGCVINDSSIVTVHLASVIKAGTDTVVCQGTTVQLFSSGGLSYSWLPAAGLSSSAVADPLATPSDSTSYIVTVTDINDCHIQDSVHVSVWKKPVANAGPDKKILEGGSVQLEGSAAGTNITFNWSPLYNISSPQALQPAVFPLQDTSYVLTVTSSQGCGVASDAVFVRVLQNIHIPNAFSPNGDGINDTWNIPKLYTYPEADVYVYNRYGQPVFHCKGYNQPWNGTVSGKKLPLGTYYYLVDLKNGLPKLGGWVIILY